jgi:hypothetical protein
MADENKDFLDKPIDLGTDEVEEPLYSEVVPAGYYKVLINKAYYRESSKKGTPSICLECTILEPIEYKSKQYFDFWLTKLDQTDNKSPFTNLNRLKTLLKAVGKPYRGDMTVREMIAGVNNGGHVYLHLQVEADDEYGDKNKIANIRHFSDPPPRGPGLTGEKPRKATRKDNMHDVPLPPVYGGGKSASGDIPLEADIILDDEDHLT